MINPFGHRVTQEAQALPPSAHACGPCLESKSGISANHFHPGRFFYTLPMRLFPGRLNKSRVNGCEARLH